MPRYLTLIGDDGPALPPEGASDHVRNALTILINLETTHPAVRECSGDLRALEALLFKALAAIERERQP